MKKILCFLSIVLPFVLLGQEKLEVQGAVILGDSDDLSPVPGTIRWTGTDFEGWNGQSWVSLTHASDGTIGAVYDIDGNSYSTVQIGNQIWMSDNLKSMKFANGDDIPSGTGVGDISNENEPRYWFANDDNLSKVPLYGLLYTWYAATDNRNVCPVGWHVPSSSEWLELIDYLEGYLMASGKMRETGTIQSGKGLWSEPNTDATNSSGFTAVPGGYRVPDGTFHPGETEEYYWSATATSLEEADAFGLLHNENQVYQQSDVKKFGHSVRCIKNQ